MDEQERRAALAQFLRTRRERISPQQVGLPVGKRRRTPGLRREELATIAGVGETWYTWLEQGRDITVSAPILESLANVLALDADERAHLFILARKQIPATSIPAEQAVDPALQFILDALGVTPAYILNPRSDFVVWNQAACDVYTDFSALLPQERNFIWFLFTDQRYRAQLIDWEEEAQRALALFRASTQRYIGEAWLTKIITDLERVSPEFCEWWPHYDVQAVHNEPKQIRHPLVGLLLMQPTIFYLADHPSLRMVVDTPMAGTNTLTKLMTLAASRSER
ncbi:transcriptional regulator [Dictyobacter alpinus]|uniref:Transcriptional regulator n=1 Tax=Dictyobacter alpinus TaxID=2014873 RepID=A0A402BDZ3_9CHLR|nr:helix-turn-helix transcriptional regulator [Dictyobacter alpinus]GCE29526.1 transcriptional regulator [Dictyobacter alpinus]